MWGIVLPENPPETLREALLEVLLETRELSLEGGCMETSRLEEASGGHRELLSSLSGFIHAQLRVLQTQIQQN